MIADLEKIASAYLRTHTAISPLGARIVGKTPDTTTVAWVRVTQLDAPKEAGSRPEHLIGYLLQFDCYAGATGGQPEANLLARTVRAALHDDLPGVRDGAVVTQVTIFGHIRVPDTDFEPARERVILTAEIKAHT